MEQYKGYLKDYPIEVVEKMLDRQEQQGNPRDSSVFEYGSRSRMRSDGGFDWELTPEGHVFWHNVYMKEFDSFFELYPKQPKQLKLF